MTQRRWIQNEEGSVIILLAFLLPLLAGLAGLVIDYTRLSVVHNRLLGAADAAALAVAVKGSTDANQISADARRYFDANFPDGYQGATVTSFSATRNSAGIYHVEVNASMSTLLLQVLHIPQLQTAGAIAEAGPPAGNVEILVTQASAVPRQTDALPGPDAVPYVTYAVVNAMLAAHSDPLTGRFFGGIGIARSAGVQGNTCPSVPAPAQSLVPPLLSKADLALIDNFPTPSAMGGCSPGLNGAATQIGEVPIASPIDTGMLAASIVLDPGYNDTIKALDQTIAWNAYYQNAVRGGYAYQPAAFNSSTHKYVVLIAEWPGFMSSCIVNSSGGNCFPEPLGNPPERIYPDMYSLDTHLRLQQYCQQLKSDGVTIFVLALYGDTNPSLGGWGKIGGFPRGGSPMPIYSLSVSYLNSVGAYYDPADIYRNPFTMQPSIAILPPAWSVSEAYFKDCASNPSYYYYIPYCASCGDGRGAGPPYLDSATLNANISQIVNATKTSGGTGRVHLIK